MQILVILHGWQSCEERWQKAKEEIEKAGIRVVVPDLPGFKKGNELIRPWVLDDYLSWTKKFIEANVTEPFFLLGHSFGGRIAIKFAARYPERLKGLILVSAAGIKRRKTLVTGYMFLSWLKKFSFAPGYNFLRKIFYRFILRKTDYYMLEWPMKETFKKVIGEDLTSSIHHIKIPTLIIWGRKDKSTPLKDAYLLNKTIKDSSLKVIPDGTHIIHNSHPRLVAKFVIDFITQERE